MKLLVALPLLLFLATSLPAADVDFAHEVAPVLKQHCGKCHLGEQKKGGLSLDTREAMLMGGESGKVVAPGKSAASDLIERLKSADKDYRMPPDGPRVPAEQIAKLANWIDAGAPWEAGFRFTKSGYEPPLKPRRPTLPSARDGRENPVDRILDEYLAQKNLQRPATVDDATFARRVSLDLVGLLPSPEELATFESDKSTDKRHRYIAQLLARDIDYAEHWLTFWNDLLRNDYAGTGFITGGRKQISKWLYQSLASNKPYDQLARELISPPTPDSAGFIDGIRWRGDVSAGQTVEIQFAQSVGQALLGINLKCASCHDSFIDRWTLAESYGLAAIYSNRPLEIHRCDKPIGQQAAAAWLFPELGQVDAKAAQPERLKQLAGLVTHRDNGRFTRTIVNRLWHRLMGRGIVHPPDAMQTEPWNADLLDFLAEDLVEHNYDLKHTLQLIASSAGYQSQIEVVGKDTDDEGYTYRGPRARRLTAEQFVDAVWQLTDTAPTRFDAPVIRGAASSTGTPLAMRPVHGKWIWSRADTADAKAGETIVLRKQFDLKTAPLQAIAALSCDNSYTLFVNGQKVHAGENWETPDAVVLTGKLKAGRNDLVIVAKNGGTGPNPAGLFCEIVAHLSDKEETTIASDESWQWTSQLPDGKGRFGKEPADFSQAAVVKNADVWNNRVAPQLSAALTAGSQSVGLKARASLLKSDFLMRALGRPNRDQIVSLRPADLTTLEAIDLANGQSLADSLQQGAKKLSARNWQSPDDFVHWLFRSTLSREPSPAELATMKAGLGEQLSPQGIEDALWSVLMLPEFQLVR
ncbi:Planctomycete cytochrome C [Anatilimnocola aggregata]|uniref:Planctomycete cytochrome C n=1 Tax=Anatilimnocola aggregata TaxID=2528021 RepID=A0A517YB92_9BACT|nr:DUF1549 domain-containing protein [Anatilimnocola aggregata]QDU27505.1 Planctomycete cytochrome C [Anatilimnocola aggregata]